MDSAQKYSEKLLNIKVPPRKIIKILLGIPDEGHTLCESYDNRLSMALHLGTLQVLSSLGRESYCGARYQVEKGVEFQFSLGIVGQVFPALARERLAEYSLDGKFDYLFMIDDDMIAPSDLFEKLYANKKDICAALAFTRNPPHGPVLYNLEKGFDPIRGERYYCNYSVKTYPKDQLVECDAVGFGAVLIKVDVLRGMKKPWFMSTSGAGEDIHFCHMAREAGFQVYMDTRVKLGHLGYPKVITEETFEQENNAEGLREHFGVINKYEDQDQETGC